MPTSSLAYASKKKAMVKAGAILKKVLQELKPHIKVGVTTLELDKLAQKLIKQKGGQISFNKVPGYRWATCLSVNEIVVHGVPNNYALKQNDLLKLDIGVYFNGYHIDYGDSFYLGVPPLKIKRFMQAGQETLAEIVSLAKAGVHIGLISRTIQQRIESQGYQVIRNLTGHAVGKELHEDPLVPQFVDRPIEKTPCFEVGKAYALEVIYSLSDSEEVRANNDGWSLKTKNNSLGCCFESTVFIEKHKTTIITN